MSSMTSGTWHCLECDTDGDYGLAGWVGHWRHVHPNTSTND